MFYAKSTGGFYTLTIHGGKIPADAVEITDAEYSALLIAQSTGKQIQPDINGHPIAVDPPPKPLAEVKAEKLAQIKAARDAASSANVTAHGRQWQADQHSQKLLNNAITLAIAGAPLPPVWRDAANDNMPITSIADLTQIAGAIAVQTQAAYAKSWELKTLVDAATTTAEVDAIIVPRTFDYLARGQ